MIFSLDVRRAREGDCLIIHYGSKQDPGLVLIDGGPAGVYKRFLSPRLMEIKKQRKLDEDASLPIDLMMVSHIDDDHINGILNLTSEMIDKLIRVKIREFWHNTFDDMIGNSPEELKGAITASFGTASLSGEPDTEGLEPATAKVLAGTGQGFRLRDDARALNLPVNSKFDQKLVMATPKGKKVDMGKGLKFTVAGPMQAELIELQKEHDKFLEAKKKEEKKEAEKALSAFTDTSVANLSSLVLLAEFGKKPNNGSILLTGDARGDKVLEGLELAGALKKGGTMHVNILKMPHHGSDRNMEPIFFERITADHYVFSGNGGYGNPERATLQWLWDVRGDADYTVHLTYPIKEIDINRKKDWETEQAKEKAKKIKNPKVEVREDWSDEKHSLESLFKDQEKFAKKLSIINEGEPHVIDLLEPLGF